MKAPEYPAPSWWDDFQKSLTVSGYLVPDPTDFNAPFDGQFVEETLP